MPRRIDVELTSAREDGSWTWRAAGAREPKGLLDGALLPVAAKVGDVLRVEADFDVDGITVVAVLPPKSGRAEPERIELRGPERPLELVTSSVTARQRPERRRRPDRADGEHGAEGGRERPRRRREERENGPTGTREQRPPRRREGGEVRERRAQAPRPPRPAPPPKPKPKRLRPGRTHRTAFVAALPEEQRPVAEQLARGGMPAVRQALEAQNAAAVAAGQPEVKADGVVALAESLLPGLRTAEWRDRAEAALADIDELDLRDLRSVVVAADAAAKDDETRALAEQLRDALGQRVEAEHAAWLSEIDEALADTRVVRALRLSSRPPKAGARFPEELGERLAAATTAGLTADTAVERWDAMLEAVAFSPVRRLVTAESLPAAPPAELQATVRRLAPQIPQLAAQFGIEPPAGAKPPRPRPSLPRRPGGRPKPGASATGGPSTPRARRPEREVPKVPEPPVEAPPVEVAEVPPEAHPDTTAEAPPDTTAEAPPVEVAEAPPEVVESPTEERAGSPDDVAELSVGHEVHG